MTGGEVDDMARNKFDLDEELEQEFSWKDFKRLARYVVPYKSEYR